MRALLIYFIVAIGLRLSNAQSIEVETEGLPGSMPRQVYFSGGTYGKWLTVQRFDYTKTIFGFDPCFTLITTKFEPKITKLPNGNWQISFPPGNL